ncbi:MAG: hypothetical protein JHC39_01420, partial [Lentimicrobium sp.]|nr:hypothetical protein [Lentimicrobium sp.]
MIYSLGFSQTPEGTWKLSDPDGLAVGPSQGTNTYWKSDAAIVGLRPCQWDDEFVFNADGSFQNVLQGSTWLETWQTASEGCGTPVAPHDGSNPATWAYSASNNTLILNGLGAFLGLPKAYNGGELTTPANAVSTITYTVSALTATNMTLDILVGPPGGAWWRFNFTKKIVGQPTIGALTVPTATVGDAPFDIVDPTSDSPGTFSYTSSNTAVATITGNTVYVVGPGNTTITCTQAAAGTFIAGQVTAVLVVAYADPATGPTDPIARNAGDVKSIYNGIAAPVAPQYTNEPGVSFQDFGGCTIVGATTLGDGNTVNKYFNHLYSGIQVGAVSLDVSAMTMLHLDVYSPNFTVMAIKLEDVNKVALELAVP